MKFCHRCRLRICHRSGRCYQCRINRATCTKFCDAIIKQYGSAFSIDFIIPFDVAQVRSLERSVHWFGNASRGVLCLKLRQRRRGTEYALFYARWFVPIGRYWITPTMLVSYASKMPLLQSSTHSLRRWSRNVAKYTTISRSRANTSKDGLSPNAIPNRRDIGRQDVRNRHGHAPRVHGCHIRSTDHLCS